MQMWCVHGHSLGRSILTLFALYMHFRQGQEVLRIWGLTLGVVVWPGPICKEPEQGQCRSLICAIKLRHSPMSVQDA